MFFKFTIPRTERVVSPVPHQSPGASQAATTSPIHTPIEHMNPRYSLYRYVLLIQSKKSLELSTGKSIHISPRAFWAKSYEDHDTMVQRVGSKREMGIGRSPLRLNQTMDEIISYTKTFRRARGARALALLYE